MDQLTTMQTRPAAIWRRALAVMVDGFIISIPLYILLFIYMAAIGAFSSEISDKATGLMMAGLGLFYLFTFVGMIVYHGYFYRRSGATPGKQLMGLKVINSETGEYLTWGQIILREFVGKLFLNTMTLYIGWIIGFFRKDKKALHDIVSSSQVLEQVR